ncbi:MAG: hypothetical protein ACI97A_001960 [Planctomycetota bacterium]|jgi:hypothetical protein
MAPIKTLAGFNIGEEFGISRSNVGDFDGDGFSDIVVGIRADDALGEYESTFVQHGLFAASLAPADLMLPFGFPLLVAPDSTNLLATRLLGFPQDGNFILPDVSRRCCVNL